LETRKEITVHREPPEIEEAATQIEAEQHWEGQTISDGSSRECYPTAGSRSGEGFVSALLAQKKFPGAV
jgi:hypothetical protein